MSAAAEKVKFEMINWKIGIDKSFSVTTGAFNKYLKRFLTTEEMQRVQSIFSKGEYEDMWKKLLKMYDYFDELAKIVSSHFNYCHDEDEVLRVKDFIEKRRKER